MNVEGDKNNKKMSGEEEDNSVETEPGPPVKEIEEELEFEEALAELEEVVSALEQGGLPLEKALEKFTRGVELVKFCRGELDRAEKKIEMVVKENDEFREIVPFEREDE
ncbi:MAG: exodeoxyribonuclease VII small subunit [Halanaerobiaceae bacterium]